MSSSNLIPLVIISYHPTPFVFFVIVSSNLICVKGSEITNSYVSSWTKYDLKYYARYALRCFYDHTGKMISWNKNDRCIFK